MNSSAIPRNSDSAFPVWVLSGYLFPVNRAVLQMLASNDWPDARPTKGDIEEWLRNSGCGALGSQPHENGQ